MTPLPAPRTAAAWGLDMARRERIVWPAVVTFRMAARHCAVVAAQLLLYDDLPPARTYAAAMVLLNDRADRAQRRGRA